MEIVSINDLCKGWVKTDDLQWVRRVGERTYQVLEASQFDGEKVIFAENTFDLDHYTEDAIRDILQPYYGVKGEDGLQVVKDTYKDFADQIIVECISESSAGCDYTFSSLASLFRWLRYRYHIVQPEGMLVPKRRK